MNTYRCQLESDLFNYDFAVSVQADDYAHAAALFALEHCRIESGHCAVFVADETAPKWPRSGWPMVGRTVYLNLGGNHD